MDEVIAQAGRFDRLIAEPGWTEITALMAERVNNSIVSATTPPEHGEGVLENAVAKTIQITRWDAQRELLDLALGHIKMVRAERDRLEEQKRMADRFEPEAVEEELRF